MTVTELTISGLYKVELDVFPDDRGSFRESWQQEKMVALGLPDFQPVQQNAAESKKGALRGIHAEPWDKYVHMAYGTAFGAYVDLRENSSTFGQVETVTLDSTTAVFIPQGVGNSYQVTSEWGVYSYLTTGHWKPGIVYPALAFDDPELAIQWPLAPLLSEKDGKNPTMRTLYPDNYHS